jgi:hypothetical protein
VWRGMRRASVFKLLMLLVIFYLSQHKRPIHEKNYFTSQCQLPVLKKKKVTVDTIITDATIYTVNNNFDKATAIAILEGKIIAVGTNEELADKYQSSTIDAKG